jgi:hypothetical protein
MTSPYQPSFISRCLQSHVLFTTYFMITSYLSMIRYFLHCSIGSSLWFDREWDKTLKISCRLGHNRNKNIWWFLFEPNFSHWCVINIEWIDFFADADKFMCIRCSAIIQQEQKRLAQSYKPERRMSSWRTSKKIDFNSRTIKLFKFI